MNKIALIQLSLAMTIFGSVGFFSELSGLPALELVFVRCICAAIFLCAAWMITGNFKNEIWNGREVMLIIFCAVANLLNWIFLFKSFELISVTIAISLYHLAPIIVLIIGSFIFREKMTLFSILAISLCFIGTLFIMGTDGFRSSSPEWEGIMYGIIAAFFYAATMLLGKSITKTSVYATTFSANVHWISITDSFCRFFSIHNAKIFRMVLYDTYRHHPYRRRVSSVF